MIGIRTSLAARRHALATVAAVLALGLTVAVTHGVPASEHMGGMGGGGMEPAMPADAVAMSVCLAVLGAALTSAGVLSLTLLARRLRRYWRPAFVAPLRFCPSPDPPPPRDRAGPSLLQVYRL